MKAAMAGGKSRKKKWAKGKARSQRWEVGGGCGLSAKPCGVRSRRSWPTSSCSTRCAGAQVLGRRWRSAACICQATYDKMLKEIPKAMALQHLTSKNRKSKH